MNAPVANRPLPSFFPAAAHFVRCEDEDVDLAMIKSAIAELRGGRVANALTDLSRACAGLKNLEDLVTPR